MPWRENPFMHPYFVGHASAMRASEHAIAGMVAGAVFRARRTTDEWRVMAWRAFGESCGGGTVGAMNFIP